MIRLISPALFSPPVFSAASGGISTPLRMKHRIIFPLFLPLGVCLSCACTSSGNETLQRAAAASRNGEKTPKTPFQRLLESPGVSEESKAERRRRKALYNPAVLNAAVNKAVKRLLKINGEKGQDITPPLSEGQAIGA
jgi:hypothetical protein